MIYLCIFVHNYFILSKLTTHLFCFVFFTLYIYKNLYKNSILWYWYFYHITIFFILSFVLLIISKSFPTLIRNKNMKKLHKWFKWLKTIFNISKSFLNIIYHEVFWFFIGHDLKDAYIFPFHYNYFHFQNTS